MSFRTTFQAGFGGLTFLSGTLLGWLAALAHFLPGLEGLLPFGTVGTHLLATGLLAAGAALVVTSRGFLRQAGGIFLLFATIGLLLPGLAPLAVGALGAVLCRHAWKVRTSEVALAEITTPLPVDGACPVHGALAGLRSVLPAEDLQTALLGMGHLPPGRTRPLLKALRKHRDVRVGLYANGLLNDQLGLFERRLAFLQEERTRNPEDGTVLTAMVETYAALIGNSLVAADEMAQTARRGLEAAGAALALDPENVPVLAARARFQLLESDFPGAYSTIQKLYTLPGCFDEARALHAELLFEHAATRPVRKANGSPVTPRVPSHALN